MSSRRAYYIYIMQNGYTTAEKHSTTIYIIPMKYPTDVRAALTGWQPLQQCFSLLFTLL